MLPYNIDSTNYAEMLRDAAREISRKSEETNAVFLNLQDQLLSSLKQIEAFEARRAEFADVVQIDEYDHPETLADFDAVPDAVAEDLYDAWDEFMQAETIFNEDTFYIAELKRHVEAALNAIGVESYYED